MTFVGFDLHKRYLTACALDASGAILAEGRQRSTSLEAVLAWLDALPGPVTVGLEATLYWEWLATRLAQAEHTVRVAHAFHVKLIWHARAKTDPIDARKLAELLRVDLFPSIWLPHTDTRERGNCCAVVHFSSGSAPVSSIAFTAISWPRISSRPDRMCTARVGVPGSQQPRSPRSCARKRNACSRSTTL